MNLLNNASLHHKNNAAKCCFTDTVIVALKKSRTVLKKVEKSYYTKLGERKKKRFEIILIAKKTNEKGVFSSSSAELISADFTLIDLTDLMLEPESLAAFVGRFSFSACFRHHVRYTHAPFMRDSDTSNNTDQLTRLLSL